MLGGGNKTNSRERIAVASSHGRQFAFISAWLSHGNVRRAMRETGVASPTTAYRWIRAYERHGLPEPHPTPTPPARRVAMEIADQVVGLRQVNPTWGKERIARDLAARYGTPVVSPTGVRSVLRQAGLWTPPLILVPHDPGSRTPIDHDWLIDELQRGIWLDLFNTAARGDPASQCYRVDRVAPPPGAGFRIVARTGGRKLVVAGGAPARACADQHRPLGVGDVVPAAGRRLAGARGIPTVRASGRLPGYRRAVGYRAGAVDRRSWSSPRCGARQPAPG